jgi:hypothetical protein
MGIIVHILTLIALNILTDLIFAVLPVFMLRYASWTSPFQMRD